MQSCGSTPERQGDTSRLPFSVAGLNRWDGWDSTAKRFLESAGERINLHDVVKRYVHFISQLHGWLRERQLDVHKGALESLERQREEIAELMAQEQ